MRLHLVFIGKTHFPEIDAGIERYLERIRKIVPVEIHILRPERITAKSNADIVKNLEGERVLKLLERQDYVVAWDERGKNLDSPAFAELLGRLRDEGNSSVRMVVGGPLGLADAVRSRADAVLSLSRMTFPHDLARLMISEQIYRAFTILKGEPYHK